MYEEYLCRGAGGPVVYRPLTSIIEVVWGHRYTDLGCMHSDTMLAVERWSLLGWQARTTYPVLLVAAS